MIIGKFPAVAAIASDAGKVLPNAVQQLTTAVTAAPDALAKGDYVAAQALVADIPARAQAVAAKVPAKRAELPVQLDTLRFALKKNLTAIQTKVDEFARTRRLPKGLSPEKLATVKETLVYAPEEWTRIEAAIQAGELDDAYGKGTVLRGRRTGRAAKIGRFAPLSVTARLSP